MARATNPQIRKAFDSVEMTAEQIAEFNRCANDVIYFVRNYIYIQHPVKGKVKFDLYDYQENLIHEMSEHRNVIVLSARQTGKSTVSAAFLLWFAIFHMDKNILIVSNKGSASKEIIKRIKFMYLSLPMWLKPGVTDTGWNVQSIAFDNGSEMNASTTSEDSGRGTSISLLYCDEFAFVKRTIQEEFWRSVSPTIATGGKCIISSTPNGDSDLYATIWRRANVKNNPDDALGTNGFRAIHVKWDDVPGRDEDFKNEEIAKIGLASWQQEYECQFISTASSLINTQVLRYIEDQIAGMPAPVLDSNGVAWFAEPSPHKSYVVGMDVATGSDNDYTVISVMDKRNFVQVAEFRSQSTTSAECYRILKDILNRLSNPTNEVYFSVENNGVGESILALYEFDENPPEFAQLVSKKGQKRKGFNTNGASKNASCLILKELIENKIIEVRSKQMLAELKQFRRNGPSFSAVEGATDDVVMSMVIVTMIIRELQMSDQDFYDAMQGYAFSYQDNNAQEEPVIVV